MNFVFPKDKVLREGTLKCISTKKGKINFDLIDPYNPLSNQIQISGTDYFFTYLDDSGKNKGGHSIILKLYESQNIDTEGIEYPNPDLILKILKYKKTAFETKNETRFKNEINALNTCKEKSFQNVIRIYNSGECGIWNNYDESYAYYHYYTMEYAPYDLKNYIETNHSKLSINDKINLCVDISKGLKELESLGYYHRDIKPDNIFFSEEDVWKIGDLGLINDRDTNFNIDKMAEPIGPRGWMSPESMNKYLTEGKGFANSFNCSIDHQSDIFQLGKVFWYIFQHNAPIGGIKEKDFAIKNSQLYAIIKTMLNHSKSKRYKSIEEVIKLLLKEERKVLKSV